MFGVSANFNMNLNMGPFSIGAGMGIGGGMGFSPMMAMRMGMMGGLMGSMMGGMGGMMMPPMFPGMMGGMGMMPGMGTMGMMGGLGMMGGGMGQMGGANYGGMSAYGNVGMMGGMMMGNSMAGIMGGFGGGMGMGMMGGTSMIGGVGAFGFRNRIEKDEFGQGGGGMGGNRDANLANSPEAVLALNSIFQSHDPEQIKKMQQMYPGYKAPDSQITIPGKDGQGEQKVAWNSPEGLAYTLKSQYGMNASVDTVNGHKAVKFPNGDYIGDGNGNGLIDASEYNFKDATAKIQQNYGLNSDMFNSMYNVNNRPFGMPAQFGVNQSPDQFYGPKFLGGAMFGANSMFGMGGMSMMGMYGPMMGMFGSAFRMGF